MPSRHWARFKTFADTSGVLVYVGDYDFCLLPKLNYVEGDEENNEGISIRFWNSYIEENGGRHMIKAFREFVDNMTWMKPKQTNPARKSYQKQFGAITVQSFARGFLTRTHIRKCNEKVWTKYSLGEVSPLPTEVIQRIASFL